MPNEQYWEMQLEIVREVLKDRSLDVEVRNFLEQIETEVVQKMFVRSKEFTA